MAFAAERRVARGRGAPFGLRENVVEARADQPRADGVDADALRTEFLCHRAGIGHQRALRGRIDRGAGTAAVAAGERRHVHYRRTFAEGGLRRLKNEKGRRSEEHTSELQSLMRISYDVLC